MGRNRGTQEKNPVAIQVCVFVGGLLIRLFQVRLGSQKVPEDTRPCLVKGLVAVAGCSWGLCSATKSRPERRSSGLALQNSGYPTQLGLYQRWRQIRQD